MLDEEILELRRKLNESVEKEENYKKIYKLSVELDDLIAEYYRKGLSKKNKNCKWRWKPIKNKILVGFLSGKKKIRVQNTLQEL